MKKRAHKYASIATPSMSPNKSYARATPRRTRRSRPEAANSPHRGLYYDRRGDDSDAKSAQSAGSARSAASAVSVSSIRSLAVGTMLPHIEEEEAEGSGGGDEANVNRKEHTPTLSNKVTSAINAEPLLGVRIISHHSSSNDDLPALHDDAISILTGHSASLPAATEPPSPYRDETSTFVSGITWEESPMRRRSQQQRHHGTSVADGSASQVSGKSKKKKKLKNPFRRRKKRNDNGEHGDNDSVSVVSGFSRISDFGSVVSGRSIKSRMSISTIGSARSRMSSLADKLRKRNKKKRKGKEVDGSNASNAAGAISSANPSTPARIAMDNRSAVSSLVSSAVGSYSATDVRDGSSIKVPSQLSSKYGESVVNTTLPTVDSGDEDSSGGDESTLGSIISALSVGSTEISKTSERIKRKIRAHRLKKAGLESKKDDQAERRKQISWNDFQVPHGLADRASAEEIMLRLGISSEAGLVALEELRNLPHLETLNGRNSAVPVVCICGVEVPDYDSYVQNSIDRFQRRLLI